MFNRYVAVLAFGAVLWAVVDATAQSGVRSQVRTVNTLTLSHAFRLPGVTLPAGTYTFESGPNSLNMNIVRVSSIAKIPKIFYQGFTTALGHPAGQSVVTFGEAAIGAPRPMLAWYPVGTVGHGFQHP
jgi:hypothetical protein